MSLLQWQVSGGKWPHAEPGLLSVVTGQLVGSGQTPWWAGTSTFLRQIAWWEMFW